MPDFVQIIRLMKRADVIELRQCLDGGLDPNLRNDVGTTMLMLAAGDGNTHIAGLLIERGAEIDAENKMRMSALSLAAFRHPHMVRLLLDHGASLSRFRADGSLDSFLGWVEANCGMTSEQVALLRR